MRARVRFQVRLDTVAHRRHCYLQAKGKRNAPFLSFKPTLTARLLPRFLFSQPYSTVRAMDLSRANKLRIETKREHLLLTLIVFIVRSRRECPTKTRQTHRYADSAIAPIQRGDGQDTIQCHSLEWWTDYRLSTLQLEGAAVILQPTKCLTKSCIQPYILFGKLLEWRAASRRSPTSGTSLLLRYHNGASARHFRLAAAC